MPRIPNPSIDYTSKDYESFRNMMLTQLGIQMPEYTDRSQTDAGIVIIELLAQGLDILSFYQDTIANETLLPTAEQRVNVMKWCNILGYYPKFSTPSQVKQVFVLASPQESDYVVPAGTSIKTRGDSVEQVVYFETAEDLLIPAGKLGNEKDEDGNYLYQVTAVQGVSINNELLGSSNGLKGQSFTLKYTPVIYDSVQVYINEGNGFELWERVNSFIDSSRDSLHYTISINDSNEAIITFGDGVFGKIPAKYENGVFCDYRTGGGEIGNVGANKVILVDSPIALIRDTFNPDLPFERGTEKESIEAIKVNAPNAYRTVWGALVDNDYADIVKINFPDIKFAQSLRNQTDNFSIDLYVLMEDGRPVTQDKKEAIMALFDKDDGGRQLSGMNKLYVHDAIFVPLNFIAEVIVKDRYSRSSVEQVIEQFLKDYFEIGNYGFGEELSITELAAQILDKETGVTGLKSFKFTSPEQDILTPKRGEIYTFQSIVFTTIGGVS